MPDDIRIVVLEGPLSSGITGILIEEGYSVTRAANASHALSKAEGAALVVLDVLAPEMDPEAWRGLEQRIEAPMLVIVPALDTGERVVAIRAPFEPDTLLEQVQRLLTEAPPPRRCNGGRVGDRSGGLAGNVARPAHLLDSFRVPAVDLSRAPDRAGCAVRGTTGGRVEMLARGGGSAPGCELCVSTSAETGRRYSSAGIHREHTGGGIPVAQPRAVGRGCQARPMSTVVLTGDRPVIKLGLNWDRSVIEIRDGISYNVGGTI